MGHDAETRRLCFVENRKLEGALLDPLDVCDTSGRRIGSFDGVVVDPEEGRVRYLVVDRGRLFPDRCLIPLPARLDVVHQALCVEEPEAWESFDAVAIPPLTRDDISTNVIARRG
jgi:sporulation protein YlmC with PRC-barrel domain